MPLVIASQNPNHAAGYGRPSYAKWFFRTLVPAHAAFDQKINSGDIPEALFNPQAMSR